MIFLKKNYQVIYIINTKKIEGLDEVIFFKKNYEVFYIINFKNIFFKGFTRGGPWISPFMKQSLNRTKKYKVIAFKKNNKDFQGRHKWRPLD